MTNKYEFIYNLNKVIDLALGIVRASNDFISDKIDTVYCRYKSGEAIGLFDANLTTKYKYRGQEIEIYGLSEANGDFMSVFATNIEGRRIRIVSTYDEMPAKLIIPYEYLSQEHFAALKLPRYDDD